MSEPASTAVIAVGVAIGEISTLPLIKALDAMPEPLTTTTSASSPYFSKSFASLAKKMMMLPMLTAGTPTRIFFKGLACGKTTDGKIKRHDKKNNAFKLTRVNIVDPPHRDGHVRI